MSDRRSKPELASVEFIARPNLSGKSDTITGSAAAAQLSEPSDVPPHSMIKELAAPGQHRPAVDGRARGSLAAGLVTRGLALLTLLTLGASVFLLGRAVYRAMSDGWIAPLQLSPDSREVVGLRMQDAKEKSTRARLESELHGFAAEMEAIELGLQRLRTLSGSYTGAINWSTQSRGNQVSTLQRQHAILETQRQVLAETLAHEHAALLRAEDHMTSGLLTRADVERARVAHQKAKVALSEAELEQTRVAAAIAEAQREQGALVKATRSAADVSPRSEKASSPDVMRFDDVQVNIQLQLARLEAEKRTALARERAARSEIASMDQLRKELDETPLFLAMQQKMDIAFVPYTHLKDVVPGDQVYACSWFVFNCRVVGSVERIFPGEVITEDPWRSLARGQYVKLAMVDAGALTEHALRVRRKQPNAR